MIALYRFVTIDDEIPRQGSISSNLVLDEPPRGKDLTREKFALPETKSETKETSYVSNGFTENVCVSEFLFNGIAQEKDRAVCSRSPYQILAYINTRGFLVVLAFIPSNIAKCTPWFFSSGSSTRDERPKRGVKLHDVFYPPILSFNFITRWIN